MTSMWILTKHRKQCSSLYRVTWPMSNSFHKSDGTVLGTAPWSRWATTFWLALFLLDLSMYSILFQISEFLNALVLVRNFHHCLQSESQLRGLSLGCRSMVVDETEVVKFPVRQAGIEAFEDVPRPITNTNCNDAEGNCRGLNDSINRCWLLGYLAVRDDDEDVVFACLTDDVHCLSDDRCQTGRTA